MVIAKGNFLNPQGGAPRLLLATGNGVVRADGHLVMGAGAAKALAQAYPWAPKVFGAMARQATRPNGHHWYLYGLITFKVNPELAVGVFQSKGDWKAPANLSLIAHSAKKLAEWLRNNPGWEVHMAFPGVGLGGLEEGEVLGVLEEHLRDLPVVLYRL
jgi:hypothetical protein